MMSSSDSWEFRIGLVTTAAAAVLIALVVWQLRLHSRHNNVMVVDSHLHVWDCALQKPDVPLPTELGDERASAEALIAEMDAAGVSGALIVQPTNYKFDHTYVLTAARLFPKRLKVMMLANPALPPAKARDYVRQLAVEGSVCGIRFNPYIWPKGRGIDDAAGMAMYQEAGVLGIPVGIMAFKGLPPLLPAIRALASSSPATVLVIDHWGFPRVDPAAAPAGQAFDETAWRELLAIADELPQLSVKVSALFRVSGTGDYKDLGPRFAELVEAFGAERLLYGSDFPYVQLHGGYVRSLAAVRGWAATELNEHEAAQVLGGNAARLFGF